MQAIDDKGGAEHPVGVGYVAEMLARRYCAMRPLLQHRKGAFASRWRVLGPTMSISSCLRGASILRGYGTGSPRSAAVLLLGNAAACSVSTGRLYLGCRIQDEEGVRRVEQV